MRRTVITLMFAISLLATLIVPASAHTSAGDIIVDTTPSVSSYAATRTFPSGSGEFTTAGEGGGRSHVSQIDRCGNEGPRVRVWYVNSANNGGQPSATVANRIRATLENVDDIMKHPDNGAESVRWYSSTDSGNGVGGKCDYSKVDIRPGTVTNGSNGWNFHQIALDAGMRDPNVRNYIFTEIRFSPNAAGAATPVPGGSKTAGTTAAWSPNVAWTYLTTSTTGMARTTVHEMLHQGGAVNGNAPREFAYHCTTGGDLMCYPTSGASGWPGYQPATPGRGCGSHETNPGSGTALHSSTPYVPVLDCFGDTYWNTNPAIGSFLRSNWNNATDNPFWGGDLMAFGGFPFTDINGNAHSKNIEQLRRYEFAASGYGQSGYGVAPYNPADIVTRGQMASFLTRVLDANGVNLPSNPAVSFSDVPGSNVHALPIRQLASLGIASGYTDGTYRPDNTVTRDQMATFLSRSWNEINGFGGTWSSNYFTDVTAGVHRTAINGMRRQGVTLGCTSTTYCPTNEVRRDHMASFLVRFHESL